MRIVPQRFNDVWQSGDFSGPNRPFRRVTVYRPWMDLHEYQLRTTFRRVPAIFGEDPPSDSPYPDGINPNKGEPCTNVYANYLFSYFDYPGYRPAVGIPPKRYPKELPNVASIQWERSVDTDAGTVRVEFYNTHPLPLGAKPARDETDQPGYFTPGRGKSPFSSRWGHQQNQWTDLLMPDNILRTYEGWGSDADGAEIDGPGYVAPERDTKLVLTGTWIIDEVFLNANGRIVVTARDPGRLLLDHIAMAPVIPNDFYPLTFKGWNDETVKVRVKKEKQVKGTVELKISHKGSGNDEWPESAYPGAELHGHSSKDAFDGKLSTYYLSVGNGSPSWRSAYEYLDINVRGEVSEVHLRTKKDGYTVYVSVKTKDGWVGDREVPYRRDGRGRYEEGLPYVIRKGRLEGEGKHVIKFKPIKDVRQVRVWLTNLQYFNLPGAKYRAAVREVKVFGPGTVTKKVSKLEDVELRVGPAGSNPGRVSDYTDIVKLLCAWAGLFWPKHPNKTKIRYSDGTEVTCHPRYSDKAVLGKGVQGRVWGDFEQTGTAPVAEILPSAFDKRTLMDGVRYIADALGFIFFFDETGAAQWRLPNIFSTGNRIGGIDYGPTGISYPALAGGSPMLPGSRVQQFVTIDERFTLTDLEVSVQSRNVREGVFVANPTGKFAAIAQGFNPNPTGLRRMAGYSDVHFESEEEAEVMADMITVRQMFKYRTDKVVIPANPAIQVDDQVRIFERVTSEGYLHYVRGITSTNSSETGRWTYTLSTHWLGTGGPSQRWLVRSSDLSAPTQAFIEGVRSASFEGPVLRGEAGDDE